jgi:hypothetical protein
MTDTLALERLYDDVSARFIAEGTDAPNVFGWRSRSLQREDGKSRIAWIPGDPSGNAGSEAPARQPGRNPRPIATFAELFTVEIIGVDPNAGEDERAQWKATRLLRDAWYRAVYLAARGTFAIKSEVWLVDKTQRRFGTMLRIVATIDSMVPDEPLASAPLKTRAVLELDELDQEEELDVGDPPFEVDVVATLATALSGELTIDGVDLSDGDLVLAISQSSPAENGPYILHAGAWERAEATLAHGFFVHVAAGTLNTGAGFELQTPNPITVDTTPLVFARLTPAP